MVRGNRKQCIQPCLLSALGLIYLLSPSILFLEHGSLPLHSHSARRLGIRSVSDTPTSFSPRLLQPRVLRRTIRQRIHNRQFPPFTLRGFSTFRQNPGVRGQERPFSSSLNSIDLSSTPAPLHVPSLTLAYRPTPSRCLDKHNVFVSMLRMSAVSTHALRVSLAMYACVASTICVFHEGDAVT